MLKTERMKRVLILGTMEALSPTVDFLYRAGSFHIIDFRQSDDVFEMGAPLPEANMASRRLLDMMSISQNLGLSEDFPPVEKIPVPRIKARIEAAISNLALEISAEAHARKEVEALLNQKRERLASVMHFRHIDLPLSLLSGYESLSVFCGRFRVDPREEIARITDAYDIIEGEVTVLFVERRKEKEVSEAVMKCGFTEVPIPPVFERPAEAINRIQSEISNLERRLEGINNRLSTLRDRHGLFVMASIEQLSIEANMAEAPLRFGTAHHSFVIDAWAPASRVDDLAKEMRSIPSGVVELIEIEWDGKKEEPPTKLSNPRPVRPMEMLMEMFSLPKYNELDPTYLMFFTFPLFYGLMLGDMGYGLAIVILVLSGAFKKLMGKLGMEGGAPALTKILLYSGISSIILGFLFDEFFGFEILGHHFEFTLMGIEFPVHRASPEMVGAMLLLCVYIGVAHLFIGYVIGFFNVKAEHGMKEAILEKGGWLLILVGFVTFSFAVLPSMMRGTGFSLMDPEIIASIILLLAGLVMTFMAEGINSVMELPGMASNILSYTRIYAVGLSSVQVALVFNDSMAMPAIESGGVGVVIGVLTLILGHALNLGLGLLGPLIQTLRLHYVEFFSKFYTGGGEKFNPLRYMRRYTKEV